MEIIYLAFKARLEIEKVEWLATCSGTYQMKENDFFFNIYLFERENASWGRVRGRESQADSPMSAELDMGLNLSTLRS